VTKQLTGENEVESVTALAARTFSRVLELERREGAAPVGGRNCFNSVDDALNAPPEDLTWQAMARLENEQPGSFTTIWERIKEYAREELESGQRAASVSVGDQRPISKARFLVLREKYIREWEPRNVLESQVIDAICQAQTIREYWMRLATERVAVECEIEQYWIEHNGKRSERQIDGSESACEAREEAERWDRVFIRSVRALRDLRRYSTAVIVNNQGGQVNLASDGGQQVNVQKKAKKKKAKAQGIARSGARRLKAVKCKEKKHTKDKQ
jgi:hypothetical protein